MPQPSTSPHHIHHHAIVAVVHFSSVQLAASIVILFLVKNITIEIKFPHPFPSVFNRSCNPHGVELERITNSLYKSLNSFAFKIGHGRLTTAQYSYARSSRIVESIGGRRWRMLR